MYLITKVSFKDGASDIITVPEGECPYALVDKLALETLNVYYNLFKLKVQDTGCLLSEVVYSKM